MKECYLKGFAAFVIAAVFLFGLFNFINQMYHADRKDFWGDEIYSLKNTIQGNTYLGLLGKGAARSEATPAPLDFIFTKIFDDMKQAVGSFGVSDKVYYRLWANFVMVFSGFVIVCLFARDILSSPSSNPVRMFQLLLLMFIPLVYLYRPMTYYYAAEVRPYALWFALWFVTIGLCSLPQTGKFILAVFLSLLAVTIVASFFQIVSVGMAYFIVRWRQNGWKPAISDSFKVFTVPLLLVIFYAYPAAYGHRSDEPWDVSWHRFYTLWRHESVIIPMLLVSTGSLWLSKRTQPMIIGPLAVLIVFLMGPLIFSITLGRGYFFSERQYIYYDAHRAVFWLSLINVLPFYLEKIKDRKKQVLTMAVIFALSVPFIFPMKTIFHLQEAVQHTMAVL